MILVLDLGRVEAGVRCAGGVPARGPGEASAEVRARLPRGLLGAVDLDGGEPGGHEMPHVPPAGAREEAGQGLA